MPKSPEPKSLLGRPFSLADALLAAGLMALVAIYAQAIGALARHPEEDAAMLLRYSQNLAEGHGIVWNQDERPVDGATDFVFMIAVALVHRAGLSLEASAQTIGIVAHGLCAVCIFLALRRLGAGRIPALVSALGLLLGPGFHYVAACYGTTLFALAACLGWYVANRLYDGEEGLGWARGLGVCAVLMGMARPEGAFLGLSFLLALIAVRGGGALVKAFLSTFLLIGLLYFLWRWSYFGHPLPNPFYKKGGGTLHWSALLRAATNILRLGGPFLVVLVAALFFSKTRKAAAFALIPLGCFTALWVLIYDETNYFMRFRYPALPLMLISWARVWQGLEEAMAAGVRRRKWLIAGFSLVLVAWFSYTLRRFPPVHPGRMGLYDVAVMLRDYERRGYTLATTEAGLLPLYSRWRAIDAWGLNDAWIAQHGTVTEDYLDRYRPEVIVFHAYFSPAATQSGPSVENRGLGRPWFDMVMTLKRYAEGRGYALAAVFGRSPQDTHYYYVRPGFAGSGEILRKIRATDYYWQDQPTSNYADPAEP